MMLKGFSISPTLLGVGVPGARGVGVRRLEAKNPTSQAEGPSGSTCRAAVLVRSHHRCCAPNATRSRADAHLPGRVAPVQSGARLGRGRCAPSC
jgi:hypothetical protein